MAFSADPPVIIYGYQSEFLPLLQVWEEMFLSIHGKRLLQLGNETHYGLQVYDFLRERAYLKTALNPHLNSLTTLSPSGGTHMTDIWRFCADIDEDSGPSWEGPRPW